MKRRLLLGGGAVALISGAGFLAADGGNLIYTALTEDFGGQMIDAPTAHRQAVAGMITLIDIRRPDEWAHTGIGEGGQGIDLREDNFIDLVSQAVDGDPNAPIALICARGVRSARVSNQLINAGFNTIIDVPEGMLGSAAGPGWIARGLPVVEVA